MQTKLLIGALSTLAVVGVSGATYQHILPQLTSSQNFECIGKVYGTPGCPMKLNEGKETETVIPPNCGD